MIRMLLYLSFPFLLSSCYGGQEQKKKEGVAVISSVDQKEDMSEAIEQNEFPFPDIPAMLTAPEDRRDYLIRHYWDNFNFADTVLVKNRNVTEQGFVNLISLMAEPGVSNEIREAGMDCWCSGMEKHEVARKVCMELADEYLYNPNSPFYNEELYEVYLKRMARSKVVDSAYLDLFQFKLKLLCRNRPGMLATSFTYYLSDGKAVTLKQTEVKGKYLMLVFYDPECPNCYETMEQMVNDRQLAQAVSTGGLSVLAVYTEGNHEVWKKTLADMPDGWIVGEDREQVKMNAWYDLKAMPSLYLLDAEKNVVLKDAPYAKIREYVLKKGE